MMDEIKVSIVTVCLNSEKTIEKTINSVLNQTYKNIEYIIVDGLSTDLTLNIISKYSDRISTLISEPDHGIYDAMNKGIKCATGNLVGIINSDDWYEIDAVEKVVAEYYKNKSDIIYGVLDKWIDDRLLERVEAGPLHKIWRSMVFGHPTVFVKKEVYEEQGYFDCSFKIAADYNFLLGAYRGGKKFSYIPELIANFTCGGISESYADMCAKETFRVINRFKNKQVITKVLEPIIRDNVYIFGAGNWGQLIMECLPNSVKIMGFIDNDNSKWGKVINGYAIWGINDIPMKALVFISAVNYENVIYRQLMDYSSDIRIIRLSDCLEMIDEIERKMEKQ